jgi:hypothetical protein
MFSPECHVEKHIHIIITKPYKWKLGSMSLDVWRELCNVDMGRVEIIEQSLWNLVYTGFIKYYSIYYLSLICKTCFFHYLLITSNKWKDKYAYIWISHKFPTQQHLECNMTTNAIMTLWEPFTKCQKTCHLNSRSKCINGLFCNFGSKFTSLNHTKLSPS